MEDFYQQLCLMKVYFMKEICFLISLPFFSTATLMCRMALEEEMLGKRFLQFWGDGESLVISNKW